MTVLKQRTRPENWSFVRSRAKYPWMVPFYGIEWALMWIAYWFSGWAFLEVLEYLGTLSLLLAVISYFSESGNRKGAVEGESMPSKCCMPMVCLWLEWM